MQSMPFLRKLTCLLGLLCLLLSANADAVEISGVQVDDTAKVGGSELKLNGAGVRYKAIFKVYVAALYLTQQTSNADAVATQSGPKRISLILLRDVTSDSFALSFMDGINHNSNKADKDKYINQSTKLVELISSLPELKKNDILSIDWLPGTGTVIQLNGKRIGDALPDSGFYNVVLKIWLGDQPAYGPLKQQLLGLPST